MDLTSPITTVIPSVQGEVLAVLARASTAMSGRRTAELTGGRASRRQVDAVLRRLSEGGVVLRERHPPANLYRLNRDHLAAASVVALADLRDQLIARMRAAVETWEHAPAAVWLFGSAARGDGTAASDIDVLILRPDRIEADEPSWLRDLDDLSSSITTWTGNHSDVLEYSESDFAALVAANDALVRELRVDALRIAGGSVEDRARTRHRRSRESVS